MADPKGRSSMEIGEKLREYETFIGTEQIVCWPDPEGDEQRQDPDYEGDKK
jgi:hypothetical protein